MTTEYEVECMVKDGRLLIVRASGEATAVLDEDKEAMEAWQSQEVPDGTTDGDYVIRHVSDTRGPKQRNESGMRWRLFRA